MTHTIHKLEVITILKGLLGRLDGSTSPSDWSKEPAGAIEGEFNGLRYRMLFWKHTERHPADHTVDDLTMRILNQAKRIKELEQALLNADESRANLEIQNDCEKD